MPKKIKVYEFRDLIPDIQDKRIVINGMLFNDRPVKVFHEEKAYMATVKTPVTIKSHEGRIFYAEMDDGKTQFFDPQDDIVLLFEGEEKISSSDAIHDPTPEEIRVKLQERERLETTANQNSPDETKDKDGSISNPLSVSEEEEYY